MRLTRAQLKKIFVKMNYAKYCVLTNAYIRWRMSQDKFVFSSTKKLEEFERGDIAVFVIRRNKSNSFNDEDVDGDGKIDWNNDLLVIYEHVSEDNANIYTFDVTADPKSNKANIAHLCEQIYRGNIGLHRGILGRVCIRSDRGTWNFRTNTLKKIVTSFFGLIGINIHDTGGFWNTSLGCVILASMDDYKNVFKPLLKRAKNQNNIPVYVINQYFLQSVLPGMPEFQEAVKVIDYSYLLAA